MHHHAWCGREDKSRVRTSSLRTCFLRERDEYLYTCKGKNHARKKVISQGNVTRVGVGTQEEILIRELISWG